MPEDLTPKVIHEYDSAELQPGGRVRHVTIVRFMVGAFGPFEHTFDRNPSLSDKLAVINAKRATLEGVV